MNVAITGGTGFIGRLLVARHLAAGDAVCLLSRRDDAAAGRPGAIRVLRGDLADPTTDLAGFARGADVLYHCAGELRDPGRMHAVHVEGTGRLLEAAGGAVGRWVQLSSVGVYGPRRDGEVNEDSSWQPANEYERTKAESDRLVLDAAGAGRVVAAVLRPSIVYGAEMPNRSLFQLIEVIRRGAFAFVGRPGASANYVHVAGVVEALHRCATRPAAAGRVYNLSDWRTIEAFVGTIAAALGRPAPSIRLPELPLRLIARLVGRLPRTPLTEARVDALTSRARYPIDRIRRELGYEHPITMEEGLRQLVEVWRSGTAGAEARPMGAGPRPGGEA